MICIECKQEFDSLCKNGLCTECNRKQDEYIKDYYEREFPAELICGTSIARSCKHIPSNHFLLYPDGLPDLVQFLLNQGDYFVPQTNWDIITLGKMEQHCIGSYAEKVRNGMCYIVCTLDEYGRIQATIDIRETKTGFRIQECKTSFNRLAVNQERRARNDIERFMLLQNNDQEFDIHDEIEDIDPSGFFANEDFFTNINFDNETLASAQKNLDPVIATGLDNPEETTVYLSNKTNQELVS